MNVFDTTKKCYKLACMDGVKTWPLCQVYILSRLDVPSLYSFKTWWKVV
jgi:hypothetical protein